MNVNTTLLNEIGAYLYPKAHRSIYNLHEDQISHFLLYHQNFSRRQREAISIIQKIMKAHDKQHLIYHVIELARVEQLIRELEPWARDHVVHALLSFVLGIYVNEKLLRPVHQTPVDDFQWKLAGLFHDVGHPMEIAANALIRPYVDTVNRISRDIHAIYGGITVTRRPHSQIRYKLELPGIENLTHNMNSFDLIQERLNRWGLRIEAKRAYKGIVESGKVCHGMISALTILFLIDQIYDEVNPDRKYKDVHVRNGGDVNFNQHYFMEDVVSACSAIYIHNLPTELFSKKRIDRSKAPVAFLLKLSDTLQEWERPSKKNPTGFPATKFDITIDNYQLILQTDIPDSKKQDMRDEIKSTLVAPDVQIL